VDARRHQPGQFVLTGSQNLLLLARVPESLAGRAAIPRLLPLSRREATTRTEAPLPWEPGGSAAEATGAIWPELLRGGYPELVASPDRDLTLWHASYVQTHLERDGRAPRQVGDLTSFQTFLRALAARNAQILHLCALARDLGVAVNTAKAWLGVLEATFQIVVLRPYFANIGKRLVKTPKVYFADTGTLCYLAGLRDPAHAAAGPMGGALFETGVLMEVVKAYWSRGLEPPLYFWRTADGTEVDLVVDTGGGLVPIEVKLSATPRPGMAGSLLSFQRLFGERSGPGYVVHPEDVRLPLAPAVQALPFGAL
jgi:hypothetical protein